MRDHTEREREAREAIGASAGNLAGTARRGEDVTEAAQRLFDAAEELAAAVRAAVLAEVREKVEACSRVRWTDSRGIYLRSTLDVADIRAALTALEATDGR